MSFIARHTFSLLSVTTFLLFMGLVLWGYNNDLNQALSVPHTLPPQHTPILTAYYTLPHTSHLTYTLANTLTQNPIKKVAFAILLSFHPPQTTLTAYAHYAQFGTVQGLPKAAAKYFGLSVPNLTIGEVLLLLHLSHHPTFPITTPQPALQQRDQLLTALYTHNILIPAHYQSEYQNPLALAADHRPIY